MVYIIRDIVEELFGYKKTTVVKVCLNENEDASYLADPKNLKNFKGDIDVKMIVL